MHTVCKFLKSSKDGKLSVKHVTRLGKSRVSITEANFASVKTVVEGDVPLLAKAMSNNTGI